MVNIILDERDSEVLLGKKVILEKWAAVVPRDRRFRSGLKYRFHACYRDGKLILRYDNSDSRNRHDAKHHKHFLENGKEKVKPLEFKPENKEDIIKLFRRWKAEVVKNARKM